jgi:thymidylate kinase
MVEPAYRVRLTALAEQIDDNRAMADLVARCFPASVPWQQLRRLVAGGEWDALLRLRSVVAGQLARRDPAGTRWRRTTARLLRFVDRRTRTFRGRGLTVALLAPDGAGKTTLARSLGRAFYLPTRYIYMGTNPNGGGITLPLTRWLARKTGRRQPIIRALSALNGLLEQGVRCRIGGYHRRRGRLVIYDRYVAKSLSIQQPGGAFRKRVRRWATQLLCPPPDMIVYLDAPADILYQRKQEHSPQSLEQQRQRYLRILDGVARTVIVDARRAPEELRRHVSGLIWRRYAVHMRRRLER